MLSKRNLPAGAISGRVPAKDVVSGSACWRAAFLVVEHIGSAPDLTADEPTFAHHIVGASDGANGDTNVIGEIALRRQFCANRQGAIANCLFDLVCNPRIKRTMTLLNVREPICHSDNYLDYTANYVNYHQCNDVNRCIGTYNEYN